MIPRKSHRKSRNGCVTCKTRKIKCDEQHPRCGNCSKGKRECVYPAKPRDDPAKHTPLSNYGSITDTNLELMTLVFNQLHIILTSNPFEQQAWKHIIKDLFWEDLSLKHVLLAISALYKYYTNTAQYVHCLSISEYHYSKCMEQFHKLTPLEFANTRANLYVAILVSMYLVASPIFKIHQINYAVEVKFIASLIRAGMKHHFLNDMLNQRVLDRYMKQSFNRIDESYLRAPEYLRELCSVMTFEETVQVNINDANFEQNLNLSTHTPVENGQLLYKQVYLGLSEHIIKHYIYIHNNTDDNNDYLPILVRWILAIPDKFQLLLSTNDPRVLILVYHFIGILASLDTSVWWSGVNLLELSEIEGKLSEDWRNWLFTKINSDLVSD